MNKNYAVVYYIYEEEFRYGVIYTDDLNYLENAEAAYDDPSYYASQTQEAIEECNIIQAIKVLNHE